MGRFASAIVHANSSKAGILGPLAAVAARVPVRIELYRAQLERKRARR
jgi:hypothetical protein